MKMYPKILGATSKAPWGEECLAFDKLDGSNLRFEWTPKQGWYKFGTRIRTFDRNDPEYGVAIDIFHNKYAEGIEKVIADKYRTVESMIVYAEFFGPTTFAGQHDPAWLHQLGVTPEVVPNDPKELVLFDVNPYKKGFVSPSNFLKHFGHLHIPKVIYQGRFTEQFVEDVRSGKYPLAEGVIAKGGEGHKLWMRKIKTFAYLNKIQKVFGVSWRNYWE